MDKRNSIINMESIFKYNIGQVLLTAISSFFISLLMTTIVEAQTGLGDIQSDISKDGNTVHFSAEHAGLQLEFCTPSMVRVRSSWDREFNEEKYLGLMVTKHDWPPVDIQSTEEEDFFDFETEDLKVRVYKSPLLIEFYSAEGRLLSTEKFDQDAGGITQEDEGVSVRKKLFRDEQFFGFGERMDFINQRGKKLNLTVGRGIGRPHIVGAYNILEANYSPVPFFMSTRGYGIFFNTPYTTERGAFQPGIPSKPREVKWITISCTDLIFPLF